MSVPIPIHDFTKDDSASVPFRYIPLHAQSSYDNTKPHRHNYYEIFFFNTGGGRHIIDFREQAVKENSIHFVSPGQVHLLQRTADCHGSILLFSRDFYYLGNEEKTSLFDFPFLNNSPECQVMEPGAEAFARFRNILELIAAEPGHNGGILRSYLNIILLKCLELFRGSDLPKTRDHMLFNQFRKLLELNYRTEKQPSAYASRLNITEKKLNEVCKRHTGTSAGESIKSRVLLEAKRLLYNTDHSVKEIAYFLGFDDPSYFNRFFRLNTGTTAGGFRERGDK